LNNEEHFFVVIVVDGKGTWADPGTLAADLTDQLNTLIHSGTP
jgi:hypothetical protein